jgi:hypothetical protein
MKNKFELLLTFQMSEYYNFRVVDFICLLFLKLNTVIKTIILYEHYTKAFTSSVM